MWLLSVLGSSITVPAFLARFEGNGTDEVLKSGRREAEAWSRGLRPRRRRPGPSPHRLLRQNRVHAAGYRQG